MWSLLLSLVPGLLSTVNGITNAIANERIAMTNATTEQARIAAQERINALSSRRDALLADTSHSNLDMWIRALFAVGPALYTVKYFIWDKVLQTVTNGSTDPINPEMTNVLIASIGFYFLYSAARIFK